MTDRFEVKTKVSEIYELEVELSKKKFDQRDNSYYHDTAVEMMTFASFGGAVKWLQSNDNVKIVSFGLVTDKTEILRDHLSANDII